MNTGRIDRADPEAAIAEAAELCSNRGDIVVVRTGRLARATSPEPSAHR